MTEVSERYATVADAFTTRLTEVRPDRWDVSSPCADWTAKDVAVHVIDTHRRVFASLDGSEPESVAPGDDLLAGWLEATGAVRGALADPVAAGRTISGMFGEQPFERLVGRLLCADTLIHTWDLARATGQDESLDANAVEMAVEFLTPIDEAIRWPGGFAPKIEPAPGADSQTTLLNFVGRTV